MSVAVDSLKEAQETLLMPLWARARESSRDDPIIHDEHAAAMVQQIDYDFSKFTGSEKRFTGFCIRSSIFDRFVSEALSAGRGSVIELGTGLDTRFQRLDDGQLNWIECDYHSVIELRERFLPANERCRRVAGSITDAATLAEFSAESERRPIFVAEGVLYFLSAEQVVELLTRLATNFPGSSFIFDAQSSFYLRISNLLHPLKTSQMSWSLDAPKDLESRVAGLKVAKVVEFGQEPYYQDTAMRRLPWHQQFAANWLPFARKFFRVIQVDFASN